MVKPTNSRVKWLKIVSAWYDARPMLAIWQNIHRTGLLKEDKCLATSYAKQAPLTKKALLPELESPSG